jgi:hypothetical protein
VTIDAQGENHVTMRINMIVALACGNAKGWGMIAEEKELMCSGISMVDLAGF